MRTVVVPGVAAEEGETSGWKPGSTEFAET